MFIHLDIESSVIIICNCYFNFFSYKNLPIHGREKSKTVEKIKKIIFLKPYLNSNINVLI